MKKLTELRIAKGLSKAELAEIAGLSNTAVILLEQGKRFVSRGSLKKLAEALKCSEEELLEGSNQSIDEIRGGARGLSKIKINKQTNEQEKNELNNDYFRDTMEILEELCKDKDLDSKQRVELASEIYKKVAECHRAGDNEKKEIISHAKIEILVNEGLVRFLSKKESSNILKNNHLANNDSNQTKIEKGDTEQNNYGATRVINQS